MNIDIAEILKGYIEEASFADKVAGLVQTAKIGITDEGGARVEKLYPVSCTATLEECKNGKYADLVPSSSYTSIMYFEDNGIAFGERTGRRLNIESRLKLICWANLKKCNKGNYSSGNMIAELLSLIPQNPFDSDFYRAISVQVLSQDIRSSAIFAKYTYNEAVSQFLMYPYDYLALNLNIKFQIIPECYEPTDDPAPDCP